MRYYNICFIGRPKNAIGLNSRYDAVVVAETKQDAVLALYDQFSHISVMTNVQMSAPVDTTEENVARISKWIRTGEGYL